MGTPPPIRLLARLGEETARWALEAERLEAVVGALAARAGPTRAEIEAVQTLDGLTQHLRALSMIAAAAAGGDATQALERIIRQTGLESLGQRLGHGVSEPASPSGEAELW